MWFLKFSIQLVVIQPSTNDIQEQVEAAAKASQTVPPSSIPNVGRPHATTKTSFSCAGSMEISYITTTKAIGKRNGAIIKANESKSIHHDHPLTFSTETSISSSSPCLIFAISACARSRICLFCSSKSRWNSTLIFSNSNICCLLLFSIFS